MKSVVLYLTLITASVGMTCWQKPYKVTYIPNPGFSGTDSFTFYTVTLAGQGTYPYSDPGTITISVLGPGGRPQPITPQPGLDAGGAAPVDSLGEQGQQQFESDQPASEVETDELGADVGGNVTESRVGDDDDDH